MGLGSLLFKNQIVPLNVFRNQIYRKFFRKRKKIGTYEVVSPCQINPASLVPDHIIKPSYSDCGIPPLSPKEPEILDPSKLEALRRTCQVAANILKSLKGFIKVGITTECIDCEVHRLCLENGAYPSPLNYRFFPKSCCTSVNNVACHGIPDSRPLKDGDIINVDVTVFKEGVHGDCSSMYLVGNVDEQGRRLCSVAKEALDEAVCVCKPGAPFTSIGAVITDYVYSHNFTVIPCFNGHGIGTYFHGPPEILHFKNNEGNDKTMEKGMCFTIEPVIGDGSPEIVILEDDWTAITEDESRTAQYEYTVLINENGAEILTPHHLVE